MFNRGKERKMVYRLLCWEKGIFKCYILSANILLLRNSETSRSNFRLHYLSVPYRKFLKLKTCCTLWETAHRSGRDHNCCFAVVHFFCLNITNQPVEQSIQFLVYFLNPGDLILGLWKKQLQPWLQVLTSLWI